MALKIGAGDLNQRITFQLRNQDKDAEGGMVDSWVDFKTVWANRNNLSGDIKPSTGNAGGDVREAKTIFTVRYQAALEDDQLRILHRGKIFQVRHCNNFMQGNEWLIFTCNTGVNDGR